jgi:hypothetical protein
MKATVGEGMRPAIPGQLERDVLVVAGHRCALPRCHTPTVEIAHIKPWAQVKAHTFNNLIALCPTCHARYDKGEIDRRAMLQYKANLSVLSGRYGEVERRVLHHFAAHPDYESIYLPKGWEILLMYLLGDGFLVETDDIRYQFSKEGTLYLITSQGREFVEKWLGAQAL